MTVVPVRRVLRRSALRRISVLVAAVLAAAGLVAVPVAAFAADTTINFDDLSSGTVVSDQYASQGITFDQAPFGSAGLTPMALSSAGAHSSPNALDIEQQGICGSEVNRVGLWARFAAPRNHVSMYVGDLESVAPEQVTLSAYDLNGTAIPAATETIMTPGGSGVNTLMSVTDPNSQISFFQVQGESDSICFAVDDVSFDAIPSAIPPDFGLSALAVSATVTAGASLPVQFVLHRNATSTGPISLAVSGLPPGVSASLSPNPVTGGDGTQVTLTLTAAAGAPPSVNVPVTVTGTPSSTAGTQQRSVTIPVSVSGTFDLRAQGIDVTQGIQNDVGVLVPSGAASGGQYQGLDLVTGKKTVVRFFADAHGAPLGIPGVSAGLRGYRNGVELPGSPLSPDYGPGTSGNGTASLPDTGEAGPAPVFRAELVSSKNAFTFTLPQSWTSGTIQLVADVAPPVPSFTGPQVTECQTPACRADNSFTLNSVTFHPTGSFFLDTLALTVNGKNPVPADQVFTEAKAVVPLPSTVTSGQRFAVFPYSGTIDVSSLISGGGCSFVTGGTVSQWDLNNGLPNDGVIGVTPTGTNGCTSGRDSEVDFTPNNASGDDRPLTSVAHELFHQFGLPHASNECGGGQDNDSDELVTKNGKQVSNGQTGEPWLPLAPAPGEPTENPPDDGIGQLNGIGLDTTTEPYAILANGVNGISQYYDFMSYCSATRGSGDGGNWLSPPNWEAVFEHFSAQPRGASVAHAQGGALTWVAAVHPARLRVIGFIDDSGKVQITSVGPQVGPGLPSPGSASGPTLVARGANGKILASVAMTRTAGHVDHVGAFAEITGTVPALGTTSLAVEARGKVLASRVRPARAPRVRVLWPARGTRVGTGPTVLVRWSAASPEHLRLTASVDYSADGGRSWRTIFIGGNLGQVRLPRFYFLGSHDARVRIRVNDGFNETAVVSAPFTAAGAPPRVSITAPGSRTRISGDGTLQLAGQAFDQELRSLSGRSLQWFDGPFHLGSGSTISAGPLPPGANRIRLVARDASGRKATATIAVTVTPVRLPFLKLTIPARVSSHASRLIIVVSSAVRARLSINGRSFTVSRKQERLTVPIRPGRRPLLLELRVKARGSSVPFAAKVSR